MVSFDSALLRSPTGFDRVAYDSDIGVDSGEAAAVVYRTADDFDIEHDSSQLSLGTFDVRILSFIGHSTKTGREFAGLT